VISITQFADNTNKELKKSITSLRKQGAKSFVIDLRQNPGGLLPQALETASMFLKDGQRIMQVQQRDSKPEIFTAGKEYDDGFKVTEPVTVLIDSGSASASEIFSGALQESRRTKLIGEKSFGKGVVQTVSQLSGDSEVKITTAKWLTPSGGWIQKKGLTPDIKVSYPAYASWPLLNTKKVNKPGTVATDIATAQKILNLSGAKLTQTAGYFDSATETALKAFQTQQKITVSGELDSATKTALNNYVYAQATKSDPMLTKAVATVAAEK
jgi:carboxyl-terminal processing protease